VRTTNTALFGAAALIAVAPFNLLLAYGPGSQQAIAQLALKPPAIAKSFLPNLTSPPLGGLSVLTVTLTNPNPSTALTDVQFTDSLPSGMTISPNPNLQNTCPGGVITGATPGSTSLSMTNPGVTLAPGSSCAVAVSVSAPVAGSYPNTAAASSSNAGPGSPATSTLVVQPLPPPLGLFTSVTPAYLTLNGIAVLNFELRNVTNTALAVTLTDLLPAGLQVASNVGLTNTCGGAFDPPLAPRATAITLIGITLAPFGSPCSVSFNVIGTVPGAATNCAEISANPSSVPPAKSCSPLTVVAPPSIAKQYVPPAIAVGGVTALTYTLTNPNAFPLTRISFTDALPAGIGIAVNPTGPNTCTGIPAPVAVGGGAFALFDSTLGPGASCSFSIGVGSMGPVGQLCSSTTSLNSLEGGAGSSALACIVVTPPPDDLYQVAYAANVDKSDAIVNITNTGVLSGADPAGRICVNVYAFDPFEEMISCCSCMVTPNGLTSLSVARDILSNTLTPGRPTSVAIKLLSSSPVGGLCNASAPAADSLVRGMRAWETTVHAMPVGSPVPYGITEIPFARSDLSASELTKLTSYCGFIQAAGSGFGLCASCRLGAQGAIVNSTSTWMISPH
jgi:uncharacterized repeat protein (TIGR01451 family)